MYIKGNMIKLQDWMEWIFIQKVLKKMGFYKIWIKWIMLCVFLVKYYVFMND